MIDYTVLVELYLAKITLYLSKEIIVVQRTRLIIDIKHTKLQLLNVLKMVVDINGLCKLWIKVVFYLFRTTKLK